MSKMIMVGIACAVAFNFFGPMGVVAVGLILILNAKK